MLFRGRISYFTHPPETHTLPTHVSAEIVTEMGKAFDWDELEKGNQEVLAGKHNTNKNNEKAFLCCKLECMFFPSYLTNM